MKSPDKATRNARVQAWLLASAADPKSIQNPGAARYRDQLALDRPSIISDYYGEPKQQFFKGYRPQVDLDPRSLASETPEPRRSISRDDGSVVRDENGVIFVRIDDAESRRRIERAKEALDEAAKQILGVLALGHSSYLALFAPGVRLLQKYLDLGYNSESIDDLLFQVRLEDMNLTSHEQVWPTILGVDREDLGVLGEAPMDADDSKF